MNRLDLTKRVRSLTRDFSNSIFREEDVIAYINEAVERIQQVIPEMEGMLELNANTDEPLLLPKKYHHLLAVYSASRCFGQDERHYQASNFMNEFEQKLDELHTKIQNGEVVITDPSTGEPIEVGGDLGTDYVVNNYYEDRYGGTDVDKGVNGVTP